MQSQTTLKQLVKMYEAQCCWSEAKQCNEELDPFKLFITCPVTNMEKLNCKEQS